MHLAHPDRVRTWLDALHRYPRALNTPIEVVGGQLGRCVQGVAYEVAAQHGVPIRVEWFDGAPAYVPTPNVRYIANDPWQGPHPSVLTAQWLGFDVWEVLRVFPERLPARLASAITAALDAVPAERTGQRASIDMYERVGEGYPLSMLNDVELPVSMIADVVRLILGLDLHLVPECAEVFASAEVDDDTSWVPTCALVPA